MKNSLFVLMLLLGAYSSHAQTEKGKFSLGLSNFGASGLLSGNSPLVAPSNGLGVAFGKVTSKVNGQTSGEETNYTTIGVILDGHYFVVDNLSVGVGANIFTQSVKSDNEKATLTLLMAGPRIRYFFPASEKMKIFIKGIANFGSSKTKYEGSPESEPTILTEFGGGAGLAFFPNPHIAINLGLAYDVFSAKNKYLSFQGMTTERVTTYSGVVFDVGFGLFF